MTTSNEKILVTATEAAAMLSIGRSTFFRNVSLGLLPKPVRMLGTIRWRVEDLRAVGQASQPTTASTPDAAADTAPGCTQPAPHQPPCAPVDRDDEITVDDQIVEIALTLKQAATQLNVSYQTVFAARERLGFRLPGSRIWRIWPSALTALGQPKNSQASPVARVDRGASHLVAPLPMMGAGGSLSARRDSRALDVLLGKHQAKVGKSPKKA